SSLVDADNPGLGSRVRIALRPIGFRIYMEAHRMNTRSFCAKFVLAISVVLASPCLRAQDGIEAAVRRANLASAFNFSPPLGGTLAGADFDNDHKLDGAVLVDSGRLHGRNAFRIELHLSGGASSELTFESADTSLAITVSDVNKDGSTDVIVE